MNDIWYNRAWLYSDRYLGDFNWKSEFIWLRRILGKMPKITPHVPKIKENPDNI